MHESMKAANRSRLRDYSHVNVMSIVMTSMIRTVGEAVAVASGVSF